MKVQDDTLKRIITNVHKTVANDKLTRIANEVRTRKIKPNNIQSIIDETFSNFADWFNNEDTIVLPYIGRFTIKEGRKEAINRNNEKRKTDGTETE